jgi:hypothetical protein
MHQLHQSEFREPRICEVFFVVLYRSDGAVFYADPRGVKSP